MKIYLFIFSIIISFLSGTEGFCQLRYYGPTSNYDSLISLAKLYSGEKKVDLLNDLAYYYSSNSLNESKNYAKQAFDLAVTLNYKQGEGYADINLARYYAATNNVTKAIELLYKVIYSAKAQHNVRLEAFALRNLGSIYLEIQNYEKCIISTSDLEKLINENDLEVELKYEVYIIYHSLYVKLQDYFRGIDYGLKFYNLTIENNNKTRELEAIQLLLYIYTFLNNEYTLNKYISEHNEILAKNKEYVFIAQGCRFLGIYHLNKKNIDSAYHYFNKGLEIARQNNDRRVQGDILTNLSSAANAANDREKEFLCVREALEVRTKWGNERYITSSLINMGRFYYNIKNYDSSLYYLNFALEKGIKTETKEYIRDSYKSLFHLYLNMGNTQKANEYYNKYTTILNQIQNEEAGRKVTLLQYYLEEDNQKKIAKEKELSQQKNIILILIISGIFALIIGGLLFYLYMTKNKDNKRLLENQKELKDTLDQLEINREELNILNKELESRVIERTVQLREEIEERKKAEEIVKNSEKELIQTNAEKDKFFSIIAHDLKNPLSGFKALTNIMAERYANLSETEKISFIKMINESSNKLFDLLQNLLDWARTKRGVIPNNPELLNMQELIMDMVTLFQISIAQKRIRIVTEIESNTVYSDKNMLRVITRNLISNAIKFTPDNSTIIISAKNVKTKKSNDFDFVQVSIKDEGDGLTQEDISKLFRIDINVKTIGKTAEKGTGLGLILCHEYVQRIGGDIWCESNQGQGCEFKFTLPKTNNGSNN